MVAFEPERHANAVAAREVIAERLALTEPGLCVHRARGCESSHRPGLEAHPAKASVAHHAKR